MNGRDGINGTMGHGLPIITPATKYDFTEAQFQMVLAQVKKVVGSQGGQVQITDPLGVMAMGLILDKLNAIEKRLTVEPPAIRNL